VLVAAAAQFSEASRHEMARKVVEMYSNRIRTLVQLADQPG